MRKGAWTQQEDDILRQYAEKHGDGKWHQVPRETGLNRCKKSCRQRWLNYLNPKLKSGDFTEDEIDLIHRLQRLLGNRWSIIAGRLPGRTAGKVKNYWNSKQRKELEYMKAKSKGITKATIVIRPQPRRASVAIFQSEENCSRLLQTSSPPTENATDSWKTMLQDTDNVGERRFSSLGL